MWAERERFTGLGFGGFFFSWFGSGAACSLCVLMGFPKSYEKGGAESESVVKMRPFPPDFSRGIRLFSCGRRKRGEGEVDG